MNKVTLFFSRGLGLTSKKEYSLADRLLGFLTLVPPIFVFLTPINAASAVALSIKGYPAWDKAILGLLAVAFAGWGINTLNHYIDRERDQALWPERAIPAGRVKAGNALASAVLLIICALLLSWFFFNPVNFFILLLAIISGVSYSAYLRDKVGYLTLPPIVGLIYLGGWAAFSPETLFNSPLPWYLYLLGLVWQAAHIMVYYPLHIGQDADGKPVIKTPAFFFTPSPQVATAIGMGFTGLTFLLSLLLPLLAPLSPIYFILVLATGIYAVAVGLGLLRNPWSRDRGLRAFASLSIFRLTISAAILFDIFVRYQV